MNELRFFLDGEKCFKLKKQSSVPLLNHVIEYQHSLYECTLMKVINVIWNTDVPDEDHTVVIDVHCCISGRVKDETLIDSTTSLRRLLEEGSVND